MGSSLQFILRQPLQNVVHVLSRAPSLLDGVRWGLEGGFRRHRELVRHHFSNSHLRVLDCGCGTGLYARHFSRAGYVGIDISQTYLQRARKRNPEYRFELMDATNLDFESSCFDAVITSGVIHHLEDSAARQVLQEIRRVLKPNGRLLLWEDIPTRNRFNFVGQTVHSLDLGDFIRSATEYTSLLQGLFHTDSTQTFCSGFMDYAVFVCRPCHSKN